METQDTSLLESLRVKNPMQTFIRFGMLAVWVVWCFRIVYPFLNFLVWGVLIAVAIHPMHVSLARWLGHRPRLAAVLLTLLQLLLVVGPVVLFASVIVGNLHDLSTTLSDGQITVPPPRDSVKGWPLIGEPLFDAWASASQDLGKALAEFGPELRTIGEGLLQFAAGAGLGVAEFAAAVLAAGFMLLHAAGGRSFTIGLGRRLAGERGPELTDLAVLTVRSVARGVLGVALIQSLAAGLGMLVLGVPLAGLWTLIGLILAVVQIGVGPVLLPVIFWAFSTQSSTAASLFLAWSIVVMLMDNVLRPLLLGRGVAVPMPVVFIGAVGGLLRSGIIGLFLGAVILSVGYKLLMDWTGSRRAAEAATGRIN